jgi:hypothetical protein
LFASSVRRKNGRRSGRIFASVIVGPVIHTQLFPLLYVPFQPKKDAFLQLLCHYVDVAAGRWLRKKKVKKKSSLEKKKVTSPPALAARLTRV